MNDLAVSQRLDKFCLQIIHRMANEPHISQQFFLESDILYKIDEFSQPLIVVPESMRIEVLSFCHDCPISGGHMEFLKTLNKVRERFYWPKFTEDVKNWVESCKDCQSYKRRIGKPLGLLSPIKPSGVFERWQMDFLGKFKTSKTGKMYLIVAIEQITKWVEAVAVSDESAKTAAKFFVENIVCRFGAPKELGTDRGTAFCSELMEEVMMVTGTEHRPSTAYHSQSQGAVERANSVIINRLAMYCSTNQKDWDTAVPLCAFAINTSVSETTKMSPYFLLYGRHATFPLEVSLNPKLIEKEVNLNDYAADLQELMLSAREIAKMRCEEVALKMSDRYNLTHLPVEFEIGSLCLVYNPQKKLNRATKLLHKYYGPFEVMQKLSDLNYVVKATYGNRETDVVHVSRMKRFSIRKL